MLSSEETQTPTTTPTTRSFPLGTVLSLTTDVLLRESFGDVAECAEFLADMPIWTHQRVVLKDPLMHAIVAQHPDLPVGELTEGERANWQNWLADQEAIHGTEISLRPAPEWFSARDPIKDAVDLVGEDRVHVLAVDDK